MPASSQLKVLLDDGEPIESVSTSIIQEGHAILTKEQDPDGHWVLGIQKN